jgi:hypothetical protein
MDSARVAALTIFGILALALLLAVLTPPEWKLGELVLLVAFMFVAIELRSVRAIENEMRRTK